MISSPCNLQLWRSAIIAGEEKEKAIALSYDSLVLYKGNQQPRYKRIEQVFNRKLALETVLVGLNHLLRE